MSRSRVSRSVCSQVLTVSRDGDSAASLHNDDSQRVRPERQEPWSSEGQPLPEGWELGAQCHNAGGRAGTSPVRPQPHGTRASRAGPGTAAGTSRESGSPDRRVATRQLRGQAGKSACGSGSGSTGSIARHRHGCHGPTDGHTYSQLGREPRR